MARDRYFESECIEIDDLCTTVRHITFRKKDVDGEMDYTPGQFIMIHFDDPNGVQINRSYSMADAAPGDGTYALCVKRVEGGLGSGLIHGLTVGEHVTTSGPYGRFVLKTEPPKHIVLVATGTGVAPFRAMIGQLEAFMAGGHDVWLLFGVRFDEELLYHDEWLALAQKHDNFHYRYCVSRPTTAYAGKKGYANVFLPEVLDAVDPEDAIAYLCGVPAMIDDVRKQLTAGGFGMRYIKTEKYVSPPPPKAKKAKAKARG